MCCKTKTRSVKRLKGCFTTAELTVWRVSLGVCVWIYQDCVCVCVCVCVLSCLACRYCRRRQRPLCLIVVSSVALLSLSSLIKKPQRAEALIVAGDILPPIHLNSLTPCLRLQPQDEPVGLSCIVGLQTLYQFWCRV